MTLFGWDASHYDGTLTPAILARAAAEGIAFFTHKIGEGISYDDPGDATALAAARSAGIEFIGGYFVPRSGYTTAQQVDYLLRLADRDEPWWRSHPGWFWQIDLERWPYDSVPAFVGIAVGKELRTRTGRQVVLYASHSQYGDQLGAWDGPIWNADYVGRTAAGFATMYPGDTWSPLHGSWRGGWTPYSGKTPTILQYTSSATIAGLTTCDANAYRGSLADLRELITGKRDQEMLLLQIKGKPEVYIVDGFGPRWIPNETILGAVKAATGLTVKVVPDKVTFDLIAPKPAATAMVDVEALASALAQKLPQASLTRDQLIAEIDKAIAATRLGVVRS